MKVAIINSIFLILKVRWDWNVPWIGKFTTEQEKDFWIYKEDKEVWNWSKDRRFAQDIKDIEMILGDELSYRECFITTLQPISPGKYKAVAEFCTTGEKIEKHFSIGQKLPKAMVKMSALGEGSFPMPD